MSIEAAVKAELLSRGVSATDAEVVVLGVLALIDVWGGAAAKKAAAAGAEAAAAITTADQAEASARNR